MSQTLNIQFSVSHPLVLGDVGWTFPPVCFPQTYCVYCFLQGGQSCWLSHRFSPSNSNNTSSPCSSLPTTGRGVTILDEEHHLWCWGCCFGRSGQVPPCAIKRQIKGFSLAHLGNHELLQSTACQLITRSREVLAAGR